MTRTNIKGYIQASRINRLGGTADEQVYLISPMLTDDVPGGCSRGIDFLTAIKAHFDRTTEGYGLRRPRLAAFRKYVESNGFTLIENH
jgi:hypothetical protein